MFVRHANAVINLNNVIEFYHYDEKEEGLDNCIRFQTSDHSRIFFQFNTREERDNAFIAILGSLNAGDNYIWL